MLLVGRYEFGLKTWDIAAGILISKLAGGKVSDFHGNNDFLQNGNLIAGNSELFDELKSVVQSILLINK